MASRRRLAPTAMLLLSSDTSAAFSGGLINLEQHHHRRRRQILRSQNYSFISAHDDTEINIEACRCPLSMTIDELSNELGGSGRAAVVWDCIRQGIDPNLYFHESEGEDSSDDVIANAWMQATAHTINNIDNSHSVLRRRQSQGLGGNAWKRLQKLMHNSNQSETVADEQHQISNDVSNDVLTIEKSIASLSHINVSPDGTTKLLLKMRKDGLEVESVIIPWLDKGFSTLCVSSQVGCKQGCTFCATGRMGKLRSLSTDEIIVQLYYASKVCRLVQGTVLPKVDNIVFMGMGEPADNAEAVVRAVRILVDRCCFGLAQSKITISTVAPDPSAFYTLGQAPASLAWSVHAVDDNLRRRLVPTTKNSMEELRVGLVDALKTRSIKLRRTMLEVALIEDMNDSDEDAQRLVDFSKSIINDVEGSKVVVNLIPYNAIDHPTYCTPSIDRVLGFQKIIVEGGVLCYVRTTRGDDESAACGQLATKKKQQKLEV
jgi:23S rRNA (adenine2503-C2)-methyltransferase